MLRLDQKKKQKTSKNICNPKRTCSMQCFQILLLTSTHKSKQAKSTKMNHLRHQFEARNEAPSLRHGLHKVVEIKALFVLLVVPELSQIVKPSLLARLAKNVTRLDVDHVLFSAVHFLLWFVRY